MKKNYQDYEKLLKEASAPFINLYKPYFSDFATVDEKGVDKGKLDEVNKNIHDKKMYWLKAAGWIILGTYILGGGMILNLKLVSDATVASIINYVLLAVTLPVFVLGFINIVKGAKKTQNIHEFYKDEIIGKTIYELRPDIRICKNTELIEPYTYHQLGIVPYFNRMYDSIGLYYKENYYECSFANMILKEIVTQSQAQEFHNKKNMHVSEFIGQAYKLIGQTKVTGHIRIVTNTDSKDIKERINPKGFSKKMENEVQIFFNNKELDDLFLVYASDYSTSSICYQTQVVQYLTYLYQRYGRFGLYVNSNAVILTIQNRSYFHVDGGRITKDEVRSELGDVITQMNNLKTTFGLL